jgi:hypothetical protein
VPLQYLGELGADFVVFKNDEKTVDEIRAMNPAGILVSPGPGGWGVRGRVCWGGGGEGVRDGGGGEHSSGVEGGGAHCLHGQETAAAEAAQRWCAGWSAGSKDRAGKRARQRWERRGGEWGGAAGTERCGTHLGDVSTAVLLLDPLTCGGIALSERSCCRLPTQA